VGARTKSVSESQLCCSNGDGGCSGRTRSGPLSDIPSGHKPIAFMAAADSKCAFHEGDHFESDICRLVNSRCIAIE
jgi:hypothetical protein